MNEQGSGHDPAAQVLEQVILIRTEGRTLPSARSLDVHVIPRPRQFLSSAVDLRRPEVRGKFLYVGEEKLWVRGVTYGTFRPDEDGNEFHDPARVAQDFHHIAACGFNAIRTYTVPPRLVLELAARYGLRVMVGIPWEQHITFLDDGKRARDIEVRVRSAVHASAGHPAVLCYIVGNEIPAPIVRWYGPRRIEQFIVRLYRAAKEEDPRGLVTYVNYPTTEYLQLPFLDLVCFNVYLESQQRLDAYLARLHNLTGDRPLIMAELGLDSLRHGEDVQARVLHWQIRTTLASGCSGAFVFAWTDEWYRGGYAIEDWAFGLTDQRRRPKPALAAVREAFSEIPFPQKPSAPRISVIVCSYNGARTIRDCFEGLQRLEYPNFEVIVVNDGSSDRTAAIVQEYGYRLITTENRGLSSARNTGLAAAKGDIVAYIDDDAWPDPHWLTYLAATFTRREVVAVGGPNLLPPGDGSVAKCVASAPGGPVHVLLSDQEAEHIPGCNMAFWKGALEEIGGFDPQFRAAGDDVDVCWRLQQRGWKLGFHPAALVWHHRRNSVRAYWRQQVSYGKAEALLERKWPEKYNTVGHLKWAGRLYGNGLTRALRWGRQRIYQGTWGCALFQSVYQQAPGMLCSLPSMPEWYLMILALGGLSLVGLLWAPLLLALPFLALAVATPVARAAISALHASLPNAPRSRLARLRLRSLTAFLHLIQPLARLWGRLQYGLTAWRAHDSAGFAVPRSRTFSLWSEQWQGPEKWLGSLEALLKRRGAGVLRGGDYDCWDLEVRGGALGAARLRMAIEEHGDGKQLVRFRSWPRCPRGWLTVGFCLATLSLGAALDQAWIACAILGGAAVSVLVEVFRQCAGAFNVFSRALDRGELGAQCEPTARMGEPT